MRLSVALVILMYSLHAYTSENTNKGKLLIVGGALSSTNQNIYSAFLDNIPPGEKQIGIIPAASGSPASSAQKFKADLIKYGAKKENIHILPIAVKDDKSTNDIDESQWKHNANQTKLVDAVKQIDAFWFVGGDQMRIIDTLRPKASNSSKVLQAIREQLEKGAIIGGTSAGAAMMSNPMIAGGDSYSSITLKSAKHYEGTPSQSQGKLYLHHGLGFFSYGITDQHFDRRARLGRLAKAIADSSHNFGFAVDEDTGILVDLHEEKFMVLGSGSATVVDTQDAKFAQKPFKAKGLKISILAPGDIYHLSSNKVTVSGDTPSVLGNEYNDHKVHNGAGHALGNGKMSELLGSELVDNAGTKEVRRYNFIEGKKGFVYRFTQTNETDAYWRYIDGTREQYTIVKVSMDILPVEIKIKNL